MVGRKPKRKPDGRVMRFTMGFTFVDYSMRKSSPADRPSGTYRSELDDERGVSARCGCECLGIRFLRSMLVAMLLRVVPTKSHVGYDVDDGIGGGIRHNVTRDCLASRERGGCQRPILFCLQE